MYLVEKKKQIVEKNKNKSKLKTKQNKTEFTSDINVNIKSEWTQSGLELENLLDLPDTAF